MPEVFKSSLEEANQEKMSFLEQAAMVSVSHIGAVASRTNLTVMSKINNVLNSLQSCNNGYKDMLLKHAENIYSVGDSFDNFDKGIADCIGVDYGIDINTSRN